MNLEAKIEAILFVANEPLTIKVLSKVLEASLEDIKTAVGALVLKHNHDNSGIHILVIDDAIKMATNPAAENLAEQFIKRELAGELTRAQLETLTVVAYRGPITRPEIEQIRGVNCALILRNLMMRGLIEEKDSSDKPVAVYSLSFEALRHLGLNSLEDLPDYASLHTHAHIDQALLKQE